MGILNDPKSLCSKLHPKFIGLVLQKRACMLRREMGERQFVHYEESWNWRLHRTGDSLIREASAAT